MDRHVRRWPVSPATRQDVLDHDQGRAARRRGLRRAGRRCRPLVADGHAGPRRGPHCRRACPDGRPRRRPVGGAIRACGGRARYRWHRRQPAPQLAGQRRPPLVRDGRRCGHLRSDGGRRYAGRAGGEHRHGAGEQGARGTVRPGQPAPGTQHRHRVQRAAPDGAAPSSTSTASSAWTTHGSMPGRPAPRRSRTCHRVVTTSRSARGPIEERHQGRRARSASRCRPASTRPDGSWGSPSRR